MKKITSITLLSLFLSLNYILAQNMLPSDVYYKQNIVVNNVQAEAPILRGPGFPGPPGGGPGGGPGSGGGGITEGDGPWVGGENSPIGDATLPLLSVAFLYAGFVLYRKSKTRYS